MTDPCPECERRSRQPSGLDDLMIAGGTALVCGLVVYAAACWWGAV